MITIIKDVPSNIAAFTATGNVTKEDFENVVFPKVEEIIEKTGELNYLLYLDTSIKNFTIGAWLKDAILGLKNITKWKRVAIVTDNDNIQEFTNVFSKIMPGEFKGFDKNGFNVAVDWVAGKPHEKIIEEQRSV